MNMLLTLLLTACAVTAQDTPTTFSGVGEHGPFTVVLDGGRVVEATLDGQDIPPEQIVRDGDHITFQDGDGDVLLTVKSAAGGVTRWRTLASEPRRMIGVTTAAVDEALAAQLGLEPDEAILVTSISDGLPAAEAGLQRLDVITAIDGDVGVTREQLTDAIRDKEEGEKLELTVVRAGQTQQISVQPRLVSEPMIGDLAMKRDAEALHEGLMALRQAQEGGAMHLAELAEMEADLAALQSLQDAGAAGYYVDPSGSLYSYDKAADADHLKRLEERLRRVEELLQQLVDKPQGGN